MGMRGTGSHDFRVKQVFIPQRLAAEVAPLTRLPAAFSIPIYRLSLATPALGAAGTAIDALIDLGKKKPNYTMSTVAERPVAQMQLARAEALLGAAGAYLYESVAEAGSTALQGQFLDQPQKIKLQLAACHASVPRRTPSNWCTMPPAPAPSRKTRPSKAAFATCIR